MWSLTEPRNHAVSFCLSELGVSLCIRFGHRPVHPGRSRCAWRRSVLPPIGSICPLLDDIRCVTPWVVRCHGRLACATLASGSQSSVGLVGGVRWRLREEPRANLH